MIHKLEVTNHVNQTLTIELRNPHESGLLLYDISGVGPSKADVIMAEYPMSSGGVVKHTRSPVRNIVMMFRYLDSPTIEASRLRSYKYFPVKQEIELKFFTGERTAIIKGIVESNTPVMFRKETYAQISILCPEPFFRTVDDMTVILNNSNRQRTFSYEGGTNTGFLATFTITGAIGPTLTFGNDSIGLTIQIFNDEVEDLTGERLKNGDIIVIDTRGATNKIRLHRGLNRYNLAFAVWITSRWPYVVPGTNILKYSTSSGANRITINIDIPVLFEGI